jgi:PKD repeat protein
MSYGQCPQFYDGNGNLSNNPYWVYCFPTNYTLNISTPATLGAYTINWGDGSPNASGGSLIPPAVVSHVYTATVDTFVVTINTGGCVIQGVVVLEEFVNASIQVPVGGFTTICAPGDLCFINSSTNVSPTTYFTWDWGDGSPVLTYDHTNSNQTLCHTYQRGTVNCETRVTLTAENYCSTGGPTVATFDPVQIWDVDDAGINASAVLLCYPDTIVHFENGTFKNCVPQGNTFQRYEYWNFGDYWGLGYDSIVDWLPWDPPARPGYDIGFPGIGTYTVDMIDSNFCGQDPASIQIQIVPPPNAGITASDDTICVGETILFNNTTTGGANYYVWDFDDGSPFEFGFWPHSHTFNTPGDYDVRIIASITGATTGCADTAYVRVHVIPSPIADFTMSDSIGCDSLVVMFTDASTDALNYQWDMGNGISGITNNPPSPITYDTGSYQVSLIVESINGCFDTTQKTIDIFSSPIVDFLPKNVCEGVVSTFLDSSISSPGDSIISWFWDFGDGSTSTLEDPNHLYVSAGTYNIIHSVSTPNCFNIDTFPMTVLGKSAGSFTPDIDTGCHALTVNFTDNLTNVSSYQWDFGDGTIDSISNPSHVFNNTSQVDSSYIVTLIVSTASGCTDTSSHVIVVQPKPTAIFTSNAVLDCAPLIVDFNNNSVGASSYIWDFGTGDTTSTVNPQYIFQNQTLFIDIYEVTLYAIGSNGCIDSVKEDITVYPEPVFTFNALPDSGCSPLVVTFPSVIGAVSYDWNFGDGNFGTGPTPTHTYINNTTNSVQYLVTLMATNPFGCKDTTYETVIVNPKPNAAFSVDKNQGCQPLVVQFQNNSTGAVNFYWDFGNGTSDTTAALFNQTFTHNSFISEFVDVELIVETQDGCFDTTDQSIEIFPNVLAAFNSDTVGCSPLEIDFFNGSLGASSYFWDFGNGTNSSAVNPTNIYMNIGTTTQVYDAELIVANTYGCTDTAMKPITVYHKPVAALNLLNATGCTPLLTTFQNNSIGVDLYDWDLGDGNSSNSSATSFTHTYTNTNINPVNYPVTLTVGTNQGCYDTLFDNVTVYPPVSANFVSDTSGCSPLSIDFVNQSIGATIYNWDFGDGVTDPNSDPNHIYTNTTINPQQFTVQLIATSSFNCSDTSNQVIVVYPSPVAGFTANPLAQVYPDVTVSYTNTTTPGNWQYSWDLGDGTTLNTQNIGNHNYPTWGNYTVFLTVSSQFCQDTISQVVTIFPPAPLAEFIGSGDGCKPVTVSFQNLTQFGINYEWDFGDGGMSTQENPTYTYYNAGTYTVKMTAIGYNGGTDNVTKVDSVMVYENAIAYFERNPKVVTVPDQAVQFYNLSNFASLYTWDFGDGTVSNEEFPEHFYDAQGVYDVQLVANNLENCPDTFRIPAAVIAEENGEVVFPDAFTPNPSGGNGGAYDPNSINNDIFFPLNEGVTDYHLQIFTRWGELIFESFDILVGWDGYYRGELCQQEVYVWKAKLVYANGVTETKVGDVTLLR